MEEEVKEQIKAMLLLLANTLQNNCVSIANDTDGNLYFFDTATFLKKTRIQWSKSKHTRPSGQ